MKFVCQVCGYVHEGDSVPEKCPVCNAPSDKFTAQLKLRTAQPQANLILQREPRRQTWTQSMIPFMRWQEMRQDTARHSRACLRDTLVKIKQFIDTKGEHCHAEIFL